MKIKLLQELNPSQKTLKAISSTHPTKIKITSGKINVLEPTNIETIIPIRYLLFYEAKIIEFYEYPEDRIKGNNFINHQTKQTFNKNELIIYMTENPENIIKPKIDTNKDFENIEKAIQKLKQQEEKLVEFYLSSSLDPETKKLILHKFIRQIEISRDEEYFIDISNIKFEKQYFNKNADEFLNDLMLSLRDDYKGFEYKQIRDIDTLLTLYENYNSISVEDYLNNTNNIHEDHKEIINNLVANQGVLVASIIIDNNFIDEVLFIQKMPELLWYFFIRIRRGYQHIHFTYIKYMFTMVPNLFCTCKINPKLYLWYSFFFINTRDMHIPI